jgi:hypothetical protein
MANYPYATTFLIFTRLAGKDWKNFFISSSGP